MKISTSTIGDAIVVAAEGELDIVSAPNLDTAVIAAISEPHNKVVLDLGGVTFMDSTGLGIVVRALKRCREIERKFLVVVTNDRVLKVFEITGLNTLIPISESLEAALSA